MKSKVKYSNIAVKYSVKVCNEKGEEILSDHHWLLLKAIDESGSLSLAADKLKISYRKAWGDLKTMEKKLGFTLLEKKRGGEGGGTSQLNENGLNFIEAYQKLLDEFQENVNQSIIKFKRTLKSKR